MTIMTKREMDTCDDKESVMLVLMKLDGLPDLNKHNE